MTRHNLKLFALSLAAALFVVGCASSGGAGSGGLLNTIGKPFEWAGNIAAPAIDPMLESQAAVQYTTLTRGQRSLRKNDPEYQRVKAIAERIIQAVDVYEDKVPASEKIFMFPSASTFKWEVNVIQQNQKNAFVMPGGKIAVYTGILPIAANDDGLAAIMGHEVAHALLRHGRERVVKNIGLQVAMQQLGQRSSDLRNNPQLLQYAGMGMNVGLLLPWSRGDETEADELGLILATLAGYDADAAVDVWKRMQSSGGQQPPEFMSTHPSHSSRIDNLSHLAPRYEGQYQKYALR